VRNQRGLTLLELILALSMVGMVLVAVATLHFSAKGSSLMIDQDVKMQGELMAIFRDMELQLRGGVSKGFLTHYPDHSLIPAAAVAQGPLFYRVPGAVWIGTLVDAGTSTKEVWYGYIFGPPARILRSVYDEDATPTWVDTVLSSGGIAPYADADLDNNGEVLTGVGSETALRDSCIDDAGLPKNLCEDKGVYPVFKTDPAKKTVSVSLSGQGTILGGKKEVATQGMTKTIFLHSTQE